MVSKLTNLLSCDKSPEFFNQMQNLPGNKAIRLLSDFGTKYRRAFGKETVYN